MTDEPSWGRKLQAHARPGTTASAGRPSAHMFDEIGLDLTNYFALTMSK